MLTHSLIKFPISILINKARKKSIIINISIKRILIRRKIKLIFLRTTLFQNFLIFIFSKIAPVTRKSKGKIQVLTLKANPIPFSFNKRLFLFLASSIHVFICLLFSFVEFILFVFSYIRKLYMISVFFAVISVFSEFFFYVLLKI